MPGQVFRQQHDRQPIGILGLRNLEVAHERPDERPIWRLHQHDPNARQLPFDAFAEALPFGRIQRYVDQLDLLAHSLADLDRLDHGPTHCLGGNHHALAAMGRPEDHVGLNVEADPLQVVLVLDE